MDRSADRCDVPRPPQLFKFRVGIRETLEASVAKWILSVDTYHLSGLPARLPKGCSKKNCRGSRWRWLTVHFTRLRSPGCTLPRWMDSHWYGSVRLRRDAANNRLFCSNECHFAVLVCGLYRRIVLQYSGGTLHGCASTGPLLRAVGWL